MGIKEAGERGRVVKEQGNLADSEGSERAGKSDKSD